MTSLSEVPPHPPPPQLPQPPLSNVLSGEAFPSPTTTGSAGYHLTSGKVAAVCFFSSLLIFLASSLYLIIRFFSSSSRTTAATTLSSSSFTPSAIDSGDSQNQSAEIRRRAVDFLPAITFTSTGGNEQECSICLGKFLRNEELRILPICCHAFHSVCVDIWLLSNLSCPLCRSSINISDSEFMKRIMYSSSTGRSSSFRSNGDLDEEEISVLRSSSSRKYEVAGGAPAPPGPWLAAEVAEQRSWLREYFDRFTSTASSSTRSVSVLGSGRFVFTGSNRRSEVGGEADDVGVEISEMFRFFSFM